MRDELLFHYEQELAYLRRMGAAFAEKYPKVASRLVLEPTKCEDPHVERLLEGFAFLAARVHLKLEDDFPEISDALLSIVYPHYLRPIPSMSSASMCRPRTRFSAFEVTVSRMSSGLVSTKFEGAIALAICRM